MVEGFKLMKTSFFITVFLLLLSCSNTDVNSVESIGILNSNQTDDITEFDRTQLILTAEMLDEDLFWKIIENSLSETLNQNEQEHYLIDTLSKLIPKDIVGFYLRNSKLMADSYTSELWCAIYIVNGGCSDDGYEYFRSWLISRGKDVYYKVVEKPDNLIEFIPKKASLEFEGFMYITIEAFKKRTGKNLYDYVDLDTFHLEQGSYPEFEFTWDEDNPESMKKLCPRLFDKYW